MSYNQKNLINIIFNITSVCLIGVAIIVFGVLYINTYNYGFFLKYKQSLTVILIIFTSLITVSSIVFFYLNKSVIYKLLLITIILIFSFVFLVYILKISGFMDKIDSVEDLRNYVANFGNFAVLIFVLLQFLQVVLLPIPSFITVGAGVLLFGPLKGAILSSIGIIAGSMIAFLIGRVFGFRVAKWLVGEDDLNKGLKMIKGKDKVILTFMFLFPFFPDDVLCFVAGITTISPTFFIIMIILTRLISVFTSSYSMNNSIIPYDTWWGILIWAILFILVIVATFIIYKYGDKIENIFSKNKKTKKL